MLRDFGFGKSDYLLINVSLGQEEIYYRDTETQRVLNKFYAQVF
jgi:hypothetical protein